MVILQIPIDLQNMRQSHKENISFGVSMCLNVLILQPCRQIFAGI